MNDDTRERIAHYVERHPDATDAELCGRFDLTPDELPDLNDTAENGDSPDSVETRPAADPSSAAESGGETAETYIADPAFAGSTGAVREHYQRARPVYEALADVDGYPTSGVPSNRHWYTYRHENELDIDELEAGHRLARRPGTFERDFEDLVSKLEHDPDDPSWRSMYTVTSWKDPEAMYAEVFATEYDEFDSGEGLPEYGDIRALSMWVDIDLADHVKPRRGDLTTRERGLIEEAYALILAEIADVYDLPTTAIAAFDSGGGMYPWAPPETTLPIAAHFEGDTGPFLDARERIFEALGDRMDAYFTGDQASPGTTDTLDFEGIWPRVKRTLDGALPDGETFDLLDPDALMNKNRQSKAPLSIHKRHDVVVTPLRNETGHIDYSPTLVSDVDDALLERTTHEVERLTAVEHDDDATVDAVIGTLFPEYRERVETAGWRDALEAFVVHQRALERERAHATARDDQRRRERRRERREELAAELDHEPSVEEVSAALADQQVTTVRQDVFDDLDRIDVSEVIRKFACDVWDTSNRGHETTFDPSWRSSGSGMSCAIPNAGDTFIDNSCNGGGGPAKAYALGTGILLRGSDAAAIPLRGRKWGEAVDGLRGEGYAIRVYVPEAGEEYDETPLWALRKAAVALDVCDPDAFVERESDDDSNGGTYQGFPDAATFNATLDALDAEGVDHGREHIDGGGSGGGRPPEPETCVPPVYDPKPFDKEEYRADLRGERYDAFIDSTGPHIEADGAGVGKSTNALLAAAERGRKYFAAFDKHQKAHEARTDGATPNDHFHIKGGEQPVHECCMQAEADADEGEPPYCPEHGHPADWPRMCPIYERATDDPLRQRFEALVGPLGTLGAHLKLGLFDDEEHPWHGEYPPWAAQFDELLDEDGRPDAERVVGVHEYQLLKSAKKGRDVIVDESPRTLADRQRITVSNLVSAQVRLQDLAELPGIGDTERENRRALAAFADRVARALASDAPSTFADLEPPALEWDTYHDVKDPMSGNYVEHKLKAETLTQLKLTYNEGLVTKIQDTDEELPSAPFCIDALLATAAKAGLDTDAVRQAIAVPPILEACPWCGSGLDYDNGARCCGSDDCDWHEAENTVTQRDGDRARAAAWLHDGDDLAPGEDPALVFGRLPDTSDLPTSPLVLDATATREKVAGLYGQPVEDVDVTGDGALALNARITQVLDGQYHAGTIESNEHLQERIQSVIDTAGEVHDRPLFGIRRKLIELFEFPENGEVLIYGGSRGLNREECDAVVCIGAPHPDMTEVRRTAELLATDRADLDVGGVEYSTRRNAPNPPVYRKLLYEDEHGDGLAVPTKHYTGLVGALFREAREKELEQFVHRTRPLLADPDDPVDGYLLTNVPTDLPIDEVCRFEELADPLHKQVGAPGGALDMQGAAVAAVENRQTTTRDGFRAETLVETDDDGTLSMNADGWLRLCQVYGVETAQGTTPTLQTIYNWLDALRALDLLDPGAYVHREGRAFSGSLSTLKSALQYLSCNTRFKVDVARRFRSLVADGADAETWLSLLAGAFESGDGVSGGHPPPDPT